MPLTQYQIDAFSPTLFSGNPAAVVPLTDWLPDTLLQAIAAENNLSETAFFAPEGEGWRLRWFTPVAEVDLCGHATLASAHVLFHHLGITTEQVLFHTRSGALTVRRDGDRLEMDFPARPSTPCTPPDDLLRGLGHPPQEVLVSDDYIAVYASEAEIRALRPDLAALARLDRRGVIVTAPGDTADFVSRFFGPKLGIPEDPVTGSAHCELMPYWASRLGRDRLRAFQCSARGGELDCTLAGERVRLAGRACTFMVAQIFV